MPKTTSFQDLDYARDAFEIVKRGTPTVVALVRLLSQADYGRLHDEDKAAADELLGAAKSVGAITFIRRPVAVYLSFASNDGEIIIPVRLLRPALVDELSVAEVMCA